MTAVSYSPPNSPPPATLNLQPVLQYLSPSWICGMLKPRVL